MMEVTVPKFPETNEVGPRKPTSPDEQHSLMTRTISDADQCED